MPVFIFMKCLQACVILTSFTIYNIFHIPSDSRELPKFRDLQEHNISEYISLWYVGFMISNISRYCSILYNIPTYILKM